jgi:prepilin-type N-terminal cleavage/methylation domain-containing protein
MKKRFVLPNFTRRKLRGFTLIELLVGIAIFSLIIGGVVGILTAGIRLQREYLLTQEALNQLSFAVEYMGRALRMAMREDGVIFQCLASEGLNYETNGDNSITFINNLQAQEKCQKFYLDLNDHTLKYVKDVGGAENTFSLTSEEIEIEDLKFEVVGASKYDASQPKVTISLKVVSPVKIELQTTISQRNLDL